MPNISDMNIVLGQASAIKQVRVGTEQDGELSRQLIAQATEVTNKKKQIQVKSIKESDKTEIRPEDDGKKPSLPSFTERVASPKREKQMNTSGGTFIDIKV